jgi:hypothetical protein
MDLPPAQEPRPTTASPLSPAAAPSARSGVPHDYVAWCCGAAAVSQRSTRHKAPGQNFVAPPHYFGDNEDDARRPPDPESGGDAAPPGGRFLLQVQRQLIRHPGGALPGVSTPRRASQWPPPPMRPRLAARGARRSAPDGARPPPFHPLRPRIRRAGGFGSGRPRHGDDRSHRRVRGGPTQTLPRPPWARAPPSTPALVAGRGLAAGARPTQQPQDPVHPRRRVQIPSCGLHRRRHVDSLLDAVSYRSRWVALTPLRA